MLPILWLPSARDDLRQIVAYIAKENLHAARRLKIRIETCVLALSEHPYLYPSSDRAFGLREIVAHPNYIILYRVAAVWVHHILQFLFSLKIYSTGVISASALWGLLLLYSTRYSASF